MKQVKVRVMENRQAKWYERSWFNLGKLRTKLEFSTIRVMIALFCKKHHHSTKLCDQCTELENYALKRIAKCPFGDFKPACSQCEVHCYKKDMRERIRIAMRYAGPRMLIYHPLYAMIHILVKLLPLSKSLKRKID